MERWRGREVERWSGNARGNADGMQRGMQRECTQTMHKECKNMGGVIPPPPIRNGTAGGGPKNVRRFQTLRITRRRAACSG